jgi:quercetin dioxygenase-like cupin family protein
VSDSDDCNADRDTPVVVDTGALEWRSSPSNTVWRKPLYRSGGEFGPVTSVVKYAAGGRFRAHAHPEGEEILVLSGVFSDEHGDYPAGSYLLNPDGSRHAPFSAMGCELFVRLRQYPGPGRRQVRMPTHDRDWWPTLVDGVSIKLLYRQPGYPQAMALVRLAAGAALPADVSAGPSEVLVVEGELEERDGPVHRRGVWIRRPDGMRMDWTSRTGCDLYLRRESEPQRLAELAA